MRIGYRMEDKKDIVIAFFHTASSIVQLLGVKARWQCRYAVDCKSKQYLIKTMLLYPHSRFVRSRFSAGLRGESDKF